MALFGQDQPNIGGGWAALGDILGGGAGRGAEAAYADQLTKNYRAKGQKADMGKAMEEESMARMQRLAQERIGDTLGAVGMDPALGGLLQAGGGNADALVRALLGGQEYFTRGDAREAALGGDLSAANANLMSLGGVQDLTKVAGGVAYNPFEEPSSDMIVTPLGQADIATKQAQAAKYAADAGLAGVKAKAGGFAPSSRTPNDEAEVLAEARAQVAAGKSPDKVAALLIKSGYPNIAAKVFVPIAQDL